MNTEKTKQQEDEKKFKSLSLEDITLEDLRNIASLENRSMSGQVKYWCESYKRENNVNWKEENE